MPPDFGPLRSVWEREMDDEADAPQEGCVQCTLEIRGQDCQAAIGFHALQEVADFDVGVAVVAILDLAAFAEKRVSLVEQEDGPTLFSRIEDAAQVLLGLADVLAHDR